MDEQPGLVARAALRLTAWTERWIPDAFIFALLATVLVFVAALVWTPSSPFQVVDAWGNGFWDLIPFTLQMSLIIITGHVLATPRRWGRRSARSPAGRARRAARWRSSPSSRWRHRGSTGASASSSARCSRAKWRGASRASTIARSRRRACSGIGSIWAQGLSGSAALQMATPGALQPQIRDIVAARRRRAGRHHPVPPHDLPLAEPRLGRSSRSSSSRS